MCSVSNGDQTMKRLCRCGSAGMVFILMIIWMGMVVMLFDYKQVALFDSFARLRVQSRAVEDVVQSFNSHLRLFVSDNAAHLYQQIQHKQVHEIMYQCEDAQRSFRITQQLSAHDNRLRSQVRVYTAEQLCATVEHIIDCSPDSARIISYDWSCC